ncbi:unnamed protein product, partial [Discosporangium mesarthrocarpum]
MSDITPWAVDVSFRDATPSEFKGVLGGLFGGGGGSKDGASDVPVGDEASLYKANTPLPVKKTLAITHTTDFEVSLFF